MGRNFFSVIFLTALLIKGSDFRSGRCDQWCRMQDPPYDAGRWLEKEQVCRCHSDHEMWELDAILLPYKIRKSQPEENYSFWRVAMIMVIHDISSWKITPRLLWHRWGLPDRGKRTFRCSHSNRAGRSLSDRNLRWPLRKTQIHIIHNQDVKCATSRKPLS